MTDTTRKIWKTTVTVTVLHDEPLEWSSLSDLEYLISEGPFIGGGGGGTTVELAPDEVERELLEIGNDGKFFDD